MQARMTNPVFTLPGDQHRSNQDLSMLQGWWEARFLEAWKSRLTAAEQVHYDLLRRRLERLIEGRRFYDLGSYLVIDHMGGIDLELVQLQLRETTGTTVLLYDQVCAAEKRRRRKRGNEICQILIRNGDVGSFSNGAYTGITGLIARGYAYKEVAKELFISIKTVETHVSSVLRKLQLSSRHELTRWANDRRLI